MNMATRNDQHRLVPVQRLDRLSSWARAKPRIALMGEFSSGKSTLLNLLIGEDLLPTKVTATELPPVWFSHGKPRAFWVARDGARHDLDFGNFGAVPREARYVRVFTPAAMLERCDIIDTPGISDPNLEDDVWRFAVGQASFILWCTSATQAWRETERSTWLSLPARLRSRSLLVVTRADKLTVDSDREKVARRLNREASAHFGGIGFLASLQAVRGKADLAQSGDAGLWERSGGADLLARIEAGLAGVAGERLALLARYRALAPDDAVAELPTAVEIAPAPGLDNLAFRLNAAAASAVRAAPAEPVAPPAEAPAFAHPRVAEAADRFAETRADWDRYVLMEMERDAAEEEAVLAALQSYAKASEPPVSDHAPPDRVEEPAAEPEPIEAVAEAEPAPSSDGFDLSAITAELAEGSDLPAMAEPVGDEPVGDEPVGDESVGDAGSGDEVSAILASLEASGAETPSGPVSPEVSGDQVPAILASLGAAEGEGPLSQASLGVPEDEVSAILASLEVPEPGMLEAAGGEVPASRAEAPAFLPEELPAAVRLWRDIVAKNGEIPSNSPIVAAIDQLLFELSRHKQPSEDLMPIVAEAADQDRAAGAENAGRDESEVPSTGWRRLA